VPYISRILPNAPLRPIGTNFGLCVRLVDVINSAKLGQQLSNLNFPSYFKWISPLTDQSASQSVHKITDLKLIFPQIVRKQSKYHSAKINHSPNIATSSNLLKRCLCFGIRHLRATNKSDDLTASRLNDENEHRVTATFRVS